MIYVRRNNQEFGPYDEPTLWYMSIPGRFSGVIQLETILQMKKIR